MPYKDPEKQKANRKEHYIKNKEKQDKLHKEYVANNKVKVSTYKREHYFMKKYGLTLSQFDAMRIAQNFECALCKKHELETPRKCLCVDHNHDTGKVRELLCESCNQALGLFYDNPDVLEKASKYLRNHDKS